MNPAQLQKMMKQAQELQTKMKQAQDALEKEQFRTTTGGGAVELVMTGDKKVVSLVIKPEVLDPEEKDILEDMIKNAFNSLSEIIDQKTEKTMGQYTQGLPF